jgi:hypothetical protein
MAVKFGLWRVDGEKVEQVSASAIASEERLEDILEARIDILGLGDLLLVGRQVITDFGKRVDLLAIDAQGDLLVIELKKDRTAREVVAQSLEYGFWVQGLSFEAIRGLYSKHHDGDDFDSAFTDHFETEIPEALNTSHQLVVVAAGMDASTEQIIEYVRGYEVPINVLFFEYLDDDGREYLARSWLADPALEASTKSGAKKQAPWNGLDYFVAVGENDERNWDDMVEYGFVSAGYGEKYKGAMEKLFVGARVWAAIPSSRAIGNAHGYVGVGTVTATAVPVEDFYVMSDGNKVNILHVELKATQMGREPTEAEGSGEYLAGVEWIDVRPREQAFWKKGMFANQNVVTKLRQPFTLELLNEEFDVE